MLIIPAFVREGREVQMFKVRLQETLFLNKQTKIFNNIKQIWKPYIPNFIMHFKIVCGS